MAGLIVIDFIDMEQGSHVRKVEKAMKEALKNDRARIQVGRISSFGLMEMSRQRLRTGVLEASTRPCPHCEGTGLMRTAASAGLSALRMVEDEAARGRGDRICLRAGKDAAVYVLNKKRAELADIELRYGVSIDVVIDDSFEGARMTVDSSGPRPVAAPRPEPVVADDDGDEEEMLEISLEDDVEDEDEDEGQERTEAATSEGDRQGRRRRRRRRGGRGRGRREGGEEAGAPEAEPTDEQPVEADAPAGEEPEPQPYAEDAEPAKGRRRRRRGRKPADAAAVEPDSSPMVERPVDEEPAIAEMAPAEEPQPKKRRTRKKPADVAEVAVTEPVPADAPPAETAEQAAPPSAEEAPKPATRKRRSKKTAAEDAEPAKPAAQEDWQCGSPIMTRPPRTICPSRAAAGGSEPSGDEGGHGRFHRAFSPKGGNPPPMKSALSRFVRMLMLALLLAMEQDQPSQEMNSRRTSPRPRQARRIGRITRPPDSVSRSTCSATSAGCRCGSTSTSVPRVTRVVTAAR